MFLKHRTTGQILTEGLRLYGRHARTLTAPLLGPLLAICMGVILWIGLVYGTIEGLLRLFPQINIWVLWAAFVFVNLPGMFLFFRGFWSYMVWMAGLNLMVRELTERDVAENRLMYASRITSRAVDYSVILTFVFSLLFIPLAVAVVPIIIGLQFFIDSLLFWQMVAVGLLIIGYAAVCVLLLALSLTFQVFAFTPASAGSTFFASADLVYRNLWKTWVVAVVTLLVTQILLPWLAVILSDLLHLTPLLSMPFEWFIRYAATSSLEDLSRSGDVYLPVKTILIQLSTQPQGFANVVVEVFLASLVGGLGLPIGTCWFALLYADLKAPVPQPEPSLVA